MKTVMIEPGTLLQERYRVAEQIGRGGMGEVYVATDERFQSRVAIKRTFYDDPEMRKAFGREAHLLNRLRHAALPKVSDHFSEAGDHFLVMEFIEGSDLSELLRQRKVPFPLADVLRWADDLLDALDYLHTQEPPVVHRDIKPPNIKLTPRGRVVLLDFGLAKGMTVQTDSGTESSIFGYSLSFAPLEQMQGSGTNPRSDLYSLAATLYFLMTGVRPTDALTRAAATVKRQPDPLRPAHLVQAQVPAAVSQILQRAMSQNSALRHASAAELRAALRQAANEPAQREAPPQAIGANIPPQIPPLPYALAQAESPAQLQWATPAAAQAYPQSAIVLRAHHSSLPAVGESDSSRGPRLSNSHTISTRVASTREGAATRPKVFIIACLIVFCAAASAYLLAGTLGSRVPDAGGNAEEAQAPGLTSPKIVPPEGTAPVAGTLSSDSSQDGAASNASAQSAPARSATGPPVSNSQSDAGAPSTPGLAGSNAKGVGTTPDGANGAAVGASTAGRPALVIQNPAPTTSLVSEHRRDEESKREQLADRPQYTNRPPPGPAYPPPPGGWRPPPPDGRRPPPLRPPYP